MSAKLSAYKAKAGDLSEIKASLDALIKGQDEMSKKFDEKMEPEEDPENGPGEPEKEAEAVKMPAKPSAKTPVKKISGPFKMGGMPKEAAPIVTGSDDDQAPEDATASEVLDSAKPNEEPALASAPVEADEMGKIAAQIAAYLNLDSKKEEAKV
jgi:hypothetical protein